MNNDIEQDYRPLVQHVGPTRYLPGTSVEIIRPIELAEPPEHVLFDFDGTLSLIRQGWPDVMVPMMVEVLADTGTSESTDDLERMVHDFVMQLTGKQTIYQMMRLAEEVAKRGGRPNDPIQYKKIYHDRLMDRIGSRREDLRTGQIEPEAMLVPGTIEMLKALTRQGTRLYLASGTDHDYVREEADLLGLTPFFEPHIYGALDQCKTFSKAHVIQRILQDNQVPGTKLLGFGDGYVEIQNIKSAGGTAVAVASDEAGRSGKPDQWKRDRLIGAGADMVIPDFQDYQAVVEYFWRKG
jgi:phosphoglycolate phosphatase-like HAD superfamily hydrolase